MSMQWENVVLSCFLFQSYKTVRFLFSFMFLLKTVSDGVWRRLIKDDGESVGFLSTPDHVPLPKLKHHPLNSQQLRRKDIYVWIPKQVSPWTIPENLESLLTWFPVSSWRELINSWILSKWNLHKFWIKRMKKNQSHWLFTDWCFRLLLPPHWNKTF